MSEPDSGSDLAAVRTKAEKVENGWVINGAKIWTSNAHRVHYLIVLARTEPPEREPPRRLVAVHRRYRVGRHRDPADTKSGGRARIQRGVLRNCFVPDDMMIGKPGEGWTRVTGELAFERAGPDRFMSDIRLLVELDQQGRARAERTAGHRDRPLRCPFRGTAQDVVLDRRACWSGAKARSPKPHWSRMSAPPSNARFPEIVRKLLPVEIQPRR